MLSTLLTLSLTLGSAAAINAPAIDGFDITWQETFEGTAGSPPNPANWNVIQSANNANGELETYTNSRENSQLSGGKTLQIVPQVDSNGQWTSARLESTYTFTPPAGKQTIVAAEIRFGNNTQEEKQGLWPAFWMLGNSIRTGGAQWPACGEIDILEMVDGKLTGFGTVHCNVAPGGICNEFNGIGGNTPVPDYSTHVWQVTIDRTPSSWQDESINFLLDGNQYFQVTGSRINDQATWASLAQNELYILLNVAVGGDFPGSPNAQTVGGFGSDMEVAYVAQYTSN